jgi:hypothetical protein
VGDFACDEEIAVGFHGVHGYFTHGIVFGIQQSDDYTSLQARYIALNGKSLLCGARHTASH